ncbi:MAG: hypothetical protein ACPLPS_01865, partial [bacterium]
GLQKLKIICLYMFYSTKPKFQKDIGITNLEFMMKLRYPTLFYGAQYYMALHRDLYFPFSGFIIFKNKKGGL